MHPPDLARKIGPIFCAKAFSRKLEIHTRKKALPYRIRIRISKTRSTLFFIRCSGLPGESADNF